MEITLETIKKKSMSGILALTGRTFVLQIIAFGATFALTILLTPSIFGVFYVVSAIVSFLSYFSDIGLAAALIQKKEAVTDEELKTTFTIQEALVLLACLVLFALSSVIQQFYNLDSSGLWLLRALIISFLLSSLKTIPSIILERKLDFGKLVIPQIVETLLFYGVAVGCALGNLGVASFSYAVIVRAIAGVVVLYLIAPWKPGLMWDRTIAKHLMKFGVPFQANSLLALVKDDLLTVVLGKVLPLSAIGYIGWAKKWAEVPLRLIMDSVIRVTFPTFSRLQHDTKLVGKAIETSFFGLAAAILPITISMIFFIRPVVDIIPRYGKWEPAIIVFYLFALSSFFAAFSTPLTNAINAIGKIKITLFLMIGWTALTWIFTLVALPIFGFPGVAVAHLLISTSVVGVVGVARKFVYFRVWQPVKFVMIAGGILVLFYATAFRFIPVTAVTLTVTGILGVILYGTLLWVMEKDRISHILATLKR